LRISLKEELVDMGMFDTTNAIVEKMANRIELAIHELGVNQANAIVEGFERGARIIADKLQEIEREKENKNVYDPPA